MPFIQIIMCINIYVFLLHIFIDLSFAINRLQASMLFRSESMCSFSTMYSVLTSRRLYISTVSKCAFNFSKPFVIVCELYHLG